MRGDKVFEPGRLILAERPIPKVELSLVFYRSQVRKSIRHDPEAVVQVFEYADPLVRRLEGDRQVLAEVGNGQNGPDAFRQQLSEQLQLRDFTDGLETDEVLLNDAARSLALPSFPVAIILLQEWLWKAAESEQSLEIRGAGIIVELMKRERMEPVVVIPSL